MPRTTVIATRWLALALLGACLAGPAVAHAADPLVVETESGAVRGQLQNGVRRFLGIPYAAPPVGALRWQPAAPPPSWTTPREATRAGAACPQIVPVVNVATGSEDCLFLNVFSPEQPRKRAPVMVWIHGGG